MKHFLTLLLISFFIISCSKDKPKVVQQPKAKENKETISTKSNTPTIKTPKVKKDPSDKKEDPKVIDQTPKDLVPGVKYRKPDLTRPKPLPASKLSEVREFLVMLKREDLKNTRLPRSSRKEI